MGSCWFLLLRLYKMLNRVARVLQVVKFCALLPPASLSLSLFPLLSLYIHTNRLKKSLDNILLFILWNKKEHEPPAAADDDDDVQQKKKKKGQRLVMREGRSVVVVQQLIHQFAGNEERASSGNLCAKKGVKSSGLIMWPLHTSFFCSSSPPPPAAVSWIQFRIFIF